MKDRMTEYQQMLEELEQASPVGLEHTLERAKQRNKRRIWLQRPLVSVAAVFACFVILVNFCTPVAYACSQIPGLRELAEAVTFSRSLGDAVENEYVQPIDIVQINNDVTLSVEYLIVDQKQVNVFFRLDSEIYEAMALTPAVYNTTGGYAGCGYGLNDYQVPNGELQSMTIDFVEEDVPGELKLHFQIEDMGSWVQEEIIAEPIDEFGAEAEAYVPDIVAEFDILLEFDPEFTAAGRVVPVNQTVELDGQTILFTDMEIYPTHLRVNVEAPEENTAWLKHLFFYVETDWGMKFEPISNGIVATGDEDSPMMVSYRADSTYFYEAKHLDIIVTGAQWLDKDRERIYVNLAEGEAEYMPQDAQLCEVNHVGDDWKIEIKAKDRDGKGISQVFGGTYYDASGREYSVESWQMMSGDVEGNSEKGYFYEYFRLENYPYDEVWLSPISTRTWEAEEPIEIMGW
ncbi:MAG: DUF4179 domain-containing protein [Lachnospiraceae bacterium]|nr:DUF4179 domain-containing protein [Lachnospiraceae bacterium]